MVIAHVMVLASQCYGVSPCCGARSQAGLKGQKLKVGAQRYTILLVLVLSFPKHFFLLSEQPIWFEE